MRRKRERERKTTRERDFSNNNCGKKEGGDFGAQETLSMGNSISD